MSELPSKPKNEADQDRSVSKDLQAYIAGTRPDFRAYYHLEDEDHRKLHETFSVNLQVISDPVVVTPNHDWEPVKLVTLMQACGSTQIVRTECLRSETDQPYAVLYEAGEPTVTD
jgi:hypothetical protein